jgi:hypothetical protein
MDKADAELDAPAGEVVAELDSGANEGAAAPDAEETGELGSGRTRGRR